MSMRCLIAPAIMVMLCSQSAAAMDSEKAADSLGNILASEEACELHYDQAAIAAWVEANVAATDMDFPDTLGRVVRVSKYEITKQSSSERTAHCVQVRRLAKTFGFTQ